MQTRRVALKYGLAIAVPAAVVLSCLAFLHSPAARGEEAVAKRFAGLTNESIDWELSPWGSLAPSLSPEFRAALPKRLSQRDVAEARELLLDPERFIAGHLILTLPLIEVYGGCSWTEDDGTHMELAGLEVIVDHRLRGGVLEKRVSIPKEREQQRHLIEQWARQAESWTSPGAPETILPWMDARRRRNELTEIYGLDDDQRDFEEVSAAIRSSETEWQATCFVGWRPVDSPEVMKVALRPDAAGITRLSRLFKNDECLLKLHLALSRIYALSSVHWFFRGTSEFVVINGLTVRFDRPDKESPPVVTFPRREDELPRLRMQWKHFLRHSVSEAAE